MIRDVLAWCVQDFQGRQVLDKQVQQAFSFNASGSSSQYSMTVRCRYSVTCMHSAIQTEQAGSKICLMLCAAYNAAQWWRCVMHTTT